MKSFIGWLKSDVINESDTRYSVEVNYRTKTDEVLAHAAKIILGYTSAALKKIDLHVRQIFDETPYRIMVSARNWDDGEWVVIASWNPNHKSFVLSKGYYNKDRKTVSVKESKSSKAESAAQLASEVQNLMHDLKDKPDRHIPKLKKIPLKTGPK